MQRLNILFTQNFSQWTKQESEIKSLSAIAVQDPFQMHPVFEHFYGFLFLNALTQFHNPLAFAQEVRTIFDKVAACPMSDNTKMLAWVIQEKFLDLLTEDQKFKMVSVLDETVEISFSKEMTSCTDRNLSILKEKVESAFLEYESFSTSAQNGLFSRWNPVPAHGPSGRAKARSFYIEISKCKDLISVNKLIKEFFNESTGIRPHSFACFFLDAIASDQEFLENTTIQEIYLQRAVAIEVLHRKGLFAL